jgi:hypothetical protein
MMSSMDGWKDSFRPRRPLIYKIMLSPRQKELEASPQHVFIMPSVPVKSLRKGAANVFFLPHANMPSKSTWLMFLRALGI